jgi:hypothetical protein
MGDGNFGGMFWSKLNCNELNRNELKENVRLSETAKEL